MAKASQPKQEAYGVSVLRAPGGGLVVVGGPIDLTRAESLSPAWTREVRQTRPTPVTSEPDGSGHTVTKVLPQLQVVGFERVHGESVAVTAKRLNRATGRLLNLAILGYEERALELLETMQRTEKPKRKRVEETAKDKRIRAERAMGFLGKSDAFVRDALLKAGRSKEQVEKYLRERAA